jgi:F1F0 ATPase subunit 2
MNEALALAIDGAVGAMLGVLFFGGLWWTVRKCLASDRAGSWMLGSLLLRMGIALGGFHLVSNGQLKPLLACLAGFFSARLAVTWLTRIRPTAAAPATGKAISNPSEASHAP